MFNKLTSCNSGDTEAFVGALITEQMFVTSK